MKLASGGASERVSVRYCELCGARLGDSHPDEGVCERILSVLCANVERKPTACLYALRVLADPRETKAGIAAEIGVDKSSFCHLIRSLRVTA